MESDANDLIEDRMHEALLRYTMPVAVVDILFTLLVLGWTLSL